MSFSPTYNSNSPHKTTQEQGKNITRLISPTSCDLPNTQHETFALTIDDMHKMNPSLESGSNTHNITTELIKANIIMFTQLKEMSQSMLASLKSLPETSETTQQIQLFDQKIVNFDKLIQKEEDKFKKIADLKNAHQQRLKMPTFGTNDKYDHEVVALTTPSFRHNDDKLTLEEFWNKVCSLTENENLSEKAVKNLLSCLLSGEAYQAYFDNKSKSLEEIVQVLIDRFGDIQTIQDKLQSLQDITREPGEKLASVMRRVSTLIDKTKHIVEQNEQSMRYDLLMTENLIKLCSQRARQRLLNERAKAARSGYNLPYKNLFFIATDAERSESTSEPLYSFPADIGRNYYSI